MTPETLTVDDCEALLVNIVHSLSSSLNTRSDGVGRLEPLIVTSIATPVPITDGVTEVTVGSFTVNVPALTKGLLSSVAPFENLGRKIHG